MNWRPEPGFTGFTKHAETARDCRLTQLWDRKWIILEGREGSGESCLLQIYSGNNKLRVSLSELHTLWYVRNASGR